MFINIYNTLIRLLYPVAIKRYIKKRQENGKEDMKRFNERIGKPLLKRPEGRLIWFHGASVGESISMLPLINRLLEIYDDAHVMVTTGTTTSADIMAKRLPNRAFHQYIPIDNPAFTTRFLRHWHPDLALWFESDFWPAMLSGIKNAAFRLCSSTAASPTNPSNAGSNLTSSAANFSAVSLSASASPKKTLTV